MQSIRACCFTFLFLAAAISAQEPGKTFLERAQELDQEAVNAIVMYPEDIRASIFEASKHPGALIRIDRLKEETKAAFEAMLAPLGEADAKKLWELSRYPGLVAALVADGPPGEPASATLAGYPEAIWPVAKEFSRGEKLALLRSLHTSNQEAAAAFETLLAQYPEEERRTFKTLLDYPEILDILTRHIDLTVELGDIYRLNPEGVVAKARSLQVELARQADAANQAWAKAIEDDPQARAELKSSADDFAAEREPPSYVYTPPSPTSGSVQVEVRLYPYSYWYGYPRYWHGPFWYPRPVWYHSGFYVLHDGTVVVVSTPSYHYTHWHFSVHHHHYRYAHLSYHYARHYDRHRHHHHGLAHAVRDWERENRKHLPRDWARERRDGTRWFEEYGRFEERFAAERARSRDRTLTRAELRERERRDPPSDLRLREVTLPDTGSVKRFEGRTGIERQRAGEYHRRSWGDRGSRRSGGGRRPRRGG